MKSKGYLLALTVLIASAAFVFIGCYTPETASVRVQNDGSFGQHIRIPVKDFVTVGLVFTENKFLITSKAIEGEIFTYQALLKEAQKLEADAIINVVIDKKFEVVTSDFNTFEQETWYGSALAIKYTDTLRQTVTVTVNNNTGTTTTSTEQVFLNESGGNKAANEQPEAEGWRQRFTR